MEKKSLFFIFFVEIFVQFSELLYLCCEFDWKCNHYHVKSWIMHLNAIIMIDYFMTNEALLQYVGKQMQQMRINARLSQQQLAERAGVSRSTVTQVENGKGMKMESIVAMLRVLNKLEILNNFETNALVSPLLIAKQEGKSPKRIRPRHD